MGWSYERAGVSIDRGNAWVDVIKGLMKNHPTDPRVVGGLGGFSGLFRLEGDLLLAACCDGVGTKMELGREAGRLEGLGQDLVAMNVNDLVTCGARPLFFLDYLACGALDAHRYQNILKGVIDACAACGCVVLGGETAEMPGVYPHEGFDLAGFAVGMVREKDLIDGSLVRPGDRIVGLTSSGVHSNGYSLVRRALREARMDLETVLPELDAPLEEVLLRPTRLYVSSALQACATGKVKGMAHITGGGLEENIQRILGGYRPALNFGSWHRPPIFDVLQRAGDITEDEMRRVFNLGIGFVFVVAPEDIRGVTAMLQDLGESPVVIGDVIS
ncbi:MAG TPA: phosphoribosylformylglycinamidine cyclo-ligase [Synergistaceae bacterium]|nr:phosphoribosylformylglycinamidine cyclo-ligase [Synergistaceae bacterium]